MRNWCQQAASAATRGLVVALAALMWVSAAGGALAQPIITDVDADDHGGAEIINFSGGTFVTITGSGLSDATAVHFGGVASVGSITVVGDNTIQVLSPAGPFATSVSVTVTTLLGTSAPSNRLVTYGNTNQTGVDTVTPSSGPAAGGTTVTITGEQFTGAIKVEFGTALATSFDVVDNWTITAVVPAGTGTVDIFVTPPHGDSNCACGLSGPAPIYTYLPAPTVTKLVRNGGSTAGGDTVILTGTGFTGATAVLFGGTPATGVTVNSATQITVVSPAGTGNVNVTVTAPGGASASASANLFYYGALQPVLTAVTPSSGPEAGGTSVTITGSDFSGASEVLFGTNAATSFTVDSNTQITAISPPGTGTVDIFVDAPCCTNAPNGSFIYVPPGPPADSVKAEQLQEQFSPVVARNSGRAITGAVTKGIALGFGGGPTANVGLAAESAFLAYAPDAAVTGAFDGFDRPGLINPAEQWSLWLDVQGSGLLSGGSGQQLNLTGGAGYRFSEDFIAGVVGGQEWFNYSADSDGLLSGSGLSAGGYVAWRFADHAMLDAALVGTALSYEVSSGTATGRFDASRWLLTSGLTGDFELGENLTVSPSARVTALWESQEGWTDSLATEHAARSFSGGTASGGATVSGEWLLLEDMTLLPYFGLFADYRFDNSDGATTSGLEGRVQAGVRLNVSASAAIDIGGELGGLFSEQRTWSLNAGVAGAF